MFERTKKSSDDTSRLLTTAGGKSRPAVPALQKKSNLTDNKVLNTVQLYNSSPVQRLSKTGYLSSDSWQNWNGSFKPGAEEKWNHLTSLYTRAAEIVNKSDDYPEELIKRLNVLFDKTIGLSEYDVVLKQLDDIHQAIDSIKLNKSGAYQADYENDLENFKGKECDFTQDPKVKILGNSAFVIDTKAILCKIKQSSFGNMITADILRLINDPLKPYEITFKEGAESLASTKEEKTDIELNYGLKDYASGVSGEIIPNTIEIVIVHELGHLWHTLKGARGEPKKKFNDLNAEEQRKWNNEEEYININNVENTYRGTIGVEKRKYHAGDPLILFAEMNLQGIIKNAEEVNISILKIASEGEPGILLTTEELTAFDEMKTLMKTGDSRTNEENVKLRSLIRLHKLKIESLIAVKKPRGAVQYREFVSKARITLSEHSDWKNKLVPETGW